MAPVRDIQKKIPETAALAFPAPRIRRSRLTDTAQTRHYRSAFRLRNEVSLYAVQDLIGGISGKLMKPPSKHARFNEYHIVILPQSGSHGKSDMDRRIGTLLHLEEYVRILP